MGVGWFGGDLYAKPKVRNVPTTEFPPAARASQRSRMTRYWEKKAVVFKIVGKPSNHYRCRRSRYRLRRDIRLQTYLLKRLGHYGCDRKAWKRCQRKKTRSCKAKKLRLRWSACYHIERRLSVVVEQILEHKKDGKLGKCSWRLKIPERFAKVYFAPYPKLSVVQKDR